MPLPDQFHLVYGVPFEPSGLWHPDDEQSLPVAALCSDGLFSGSVRLVAVLVSNVLARLVEWQAAQPVAWVPPVIVPCAIFSVRNPFG